MPLSVSVFGLGLMGRPIARTLIARGVLVQGWNRSPLAHSLQEAADADVCLLMLADSAGVAAVLGQLEGSLRAGQTVLDMGTSDPDSSRAPAERLAAKGIRWVDAPVSGGPEGAAAGALATMAGRARGEVGGP